MPLYKSAQFAQDINDAKHTAVDEVDMGNDIENMGDEDEVIIYNAKPEMEDVIELHDEEPKVLSFALPSLPGSEMSMPLELSFDEPGNDEAQEEMHKQEAKKDPWKSEPDSIMEWIKERFANIPKHDGKSTLGIERAIAYLKRLNSEISRCISSDLDGKVDISALESARKEIIDGIERLEAACDKLHESNYKRKKKANVEIDENGLLKTAKQTAINGIMITVPLLISTIARTAINSMVSAGKDIERVAAQLCTEYELSHREKTELYQLLADMGYAVNNRPRGFPDNKSFDMTDVDNLDYLANYPS